MVISMVIKGMSSWNDKLKSGFWLFRFTRLLTTTTTRLLSTKPHAGKWRIAFNSVYTTPICKPTTQRIPWPERLGSTTHRFNLVLYIGSRAMEISLYGVSLDLHLVARCIESQSRSLSMDFPFAWIHQKKKKKFISSTHGHSRSNLTAIFDIILSRNNGYFIRSYTVFRRHILLFLLSIREMDVFIVIHYWTSERFT